MVCVYVNNFKVFNMPNDYRSDFNKNSPPAEIGQVTNFSDFGLVADIEVIRGDATSPDY